MGGGLAPILKRIVQAWQTDGSYQRTSGADPGFGRGRGQLLRLEVADVAKQSRSKQSAERSEAGKFLNLNYDKATYLKNAQFLGLKT